MESLVASQVQEMELVRQKVYNLEQTQLQIKQRYGLLRRLGDDVIVDMRLWKDTKKTLHGSVTSLRLAEDHLPMSASAVSRHMLVFPSLSHLLLVMVQVIFSEASWQTHRARELPASSPQLRTSSNNKGLLHTRWDLRKACSRVVSEATLPLTVSMVASNALVLNIF